MEKNKINKKGKDAISFNFEEKKKKYENIKMISKNQNEVKKNAKNH